MQKMTLHDFKSGEKITIDISSQTRMTVTEMAVSPDHGTEVTFFEGNLKRSLFVAETPHDIQSRFHIFQDMEFRK